MTENGRYGDNRTYLLPDEWPAASTEVLGTATDKALAALTRAAATDDLARYYDPSGSYAGTLFLDVQPNDPNSIEAADLYAVTTLSIELDARHGRLLLDEGEARAGVRQDLSSLEQQITITDLEEAEGGSSQLLAQMYALHSRFSTLLSGNSNRWVTAAKLCARKRPRLFPVRDNLVCTYLGDGRPLKSGDGWPGDFSIDIQVYAHLMTSPDIKSKLSDLREDLMEDHGLRVDSEDLRLLDSALWMAAKKKDPAGTR